MTVACEYVRKNRSMVDHGFLLQNRPFRFFGRESSSRRLCGIQSWKPWNILDQPRDSSKPRASSQRREPKRRNIQACNIGQVPEALSFLDLFPPLY